MPSYTRGQRRDKFVFVKVSTSSNLYYGFKTKDFGAIAGVSAADITALGHLEASALPASRITIVGANSPKPPRVKKITNNAPSATQQGSVSTYCAISSLATATAAGWQMVDGGRGVKVTNNTRTVTVGAKIEGGGYYLFPMNASDVTTYAAALGLETAPNISATERAQAFSGSSYPKPDIVSITTANGNFSSFCSFDAIDAALAAGYEILKTRKPHPVPASGGTTPTP